MVWKETGKIFAVHGGYLQDWLLYDTDYNWRIQPEIRGNCGQQGTLGRIGSITFYTYGTKKSQKFYGFDGLRT